MPKRSVKRNKNTGSKKVEPKVVVTNAIKVHEENDSSEFVDGSQNATGINWIDLPEEVLVMIFEFLSRYDLVDAREVCRQWRRVAVCKWLLPVWRQLEVAFSFNDQEVYNSLEYKTLRAAPVLDGLCFEDVSLNQFTEVASKIVAGNKKKEVRYLDFDNCYARDDDLLKVLQCYGSHVEQLCSERLRIQWTNEREKPIFSYLPNLQRIELVLNSAADYDGDGKPEDYSSSTPWPQEHNLLFFPRRLNNLYHFKNQLTKIDIDYSTVLSLPHWEEYVFKMPKLEFLSVYCECEEIGDESAEFEWSRNGDSMSFKIKSDFESAKFLMHVSYKFSFDRIETLKLVGELTLDLITMRDPVVIGKIAQILRMFTKLKRLNLLQRCNCGDKGNCRFDQNVFIKILLSVPKLECLHFKGCKSFLEFNRGNLSFRFPRVKIECEKFDLWED